MSDSDYNELPGSNAMIARIVFYIVLTVGISGCSDGAPMFASAYKDADEYQSLQQAQRAKTEFLAYTHRIKVEVARSELSSVFNSVLEACIAETEYTCLIMNSKESGGEYAYGQITLRVSPNGVAKYKKMVTDSGSVAQQSMSAEDLTEVVKDTEQRLDMLTAYKTQLQQLEQRPNIDVDALIKLSSELAEVQTQIEYTLGQKAKLYQRINMEVLEITLDSSAHRSFYSPIGDAFSTFGENVSEGLAVFITAIAYLFPWVLLLIFLIWLLRSFWVRRSNH